MQHRNKVFVNASNCMSGGGRTLVLGLLNGIQHYPEYDFVLYIDSRFVMTNVYEGNIEFVSIKRWFRYKVAFMIRKRMEKNDIIFYFGNLPPLIKFPGLRVFLLQSNRFMIEKYSLRGFDVKRKIIITLERTYFNMFYNNVTDIIVQTGTMLNLLKKFKHQKPAYVLPSYDLNSVNFEDVGTEDKIPNTFLYVASMYPYKNHKRLLQAWKKLKDAGHSPTLYITTDENNKLKKWIIDFVSCNSVNVILLHKLSREELLKIYKKTEVLIFPSLFESYGLPLVEAKIFRMKVIASDLDFSWDLIDPDDYFNPFDVNSIVRAVERHLSIQREKDSVLNSEEFLDAFLKIKDINI